jgi:hypothetical protein
MWFLGAGWSPKVEDSSENEIDNIELSLQDQYPNGCCCTKCQEISLYAVPNQKDGTFKCYYCRTYR